MKGEENLKQLKEDYEKLRKKHDLPNFEELNQEFVLEDLQQLKTEILPKKLRFLVWRKLGDTLGILERFINPAHASILIMTVADKLSEEDKKLFEQIYSELGKLELEFWKLESAPYSEKDEIEFVKKVLKKFKEVKPKLNNFASRACKLYEESLKKK